MKSNNPTIKELREKCQGVHKGDVTVEVVRVVSVYFTWLAVRLGLSGNMVSITNIFVSIAVSVCFFLGGWHYLTGVALLVLGLILDSVDGEVARFREQAGLTGLFVDRMNSVFLYSGPYFFALLGIASEVNFLLVTSLGFFAGAGMLAIRLTKTYVEATIIDGLMAEKTRDHRRTSFDDFNFLDTDKTIRSKRNALLWCVDLILVRQIGIMSVMSCAAILQYFSPAGSPLFQSPIFWFGAIYAVLAPGAVVYGFYSFVRERTAERNFEAIVRKFSGGAE